MMSMHSASATLLMGNVLFMRGQGHRRPVWRAQGSEGRRVGVRLGGRTLWQSLGWLARGAVQCSAGVGEGSLSEE